MGRGKFPQIARFKYSLQVLLIFIPTSYRKNVTWVKVRARTFHIHVIIMFTFIISFSYRCGMYIIRIIVFSKTHVASSFCYLASRHHPYHFWGRKYNF